MNGEDVRARREALGWSQERLADLVSRSQATISAVEHGKSEPAALLREIERVLDAAERGEVLEDHVYRGGVRVESSVAEPERPYRVDPPSSSGSGAVGRESAGRQPAVLTVGRFDDWVLPPPFKVLLTWRRPEQSGDLAVIASLESGAVPVVGIDIVGHGPSVYPASLYLRGWINGWIQGISTTPQVQSLSDELAEVLQRIDVEAACFVCLLTPRRGSSAGLVYDGISLGFPPPLLIAGPQLEMKTSGSISSSLPGLRGDHAIPAPTHQELSGPVCLVIASDGLLSRIGSGSEHEGKRVLRAWQQSRERDTGIETFLATDALVLDDELCILLQWEHWDHDVAFLADDDDERHRVLGLLEKRAIDALGSKRGSGLASAVVEAMCNVMRHAYRGISGRVRIRDVNEVELFRVEVEDHGAGNGYRQLATDLTAQPSGQTLIDHFCDAVDVRDGADGGTILSMAVKKP